MVRARNQVKVERNQPRAGDSKGKSKSKYVEEADFILTQSKQKTKSKSGGAAAAASSGTSKNKKLAQKKTPKAKAAAAAAASDDESDDGSASDMSGDEQQDEEEDDDGWAARRNGSEDDADESSASESEEEEQEAILDVLPEPKSFIEEMKRRKRETTAAFREAQKKRAIETRNKRLRAALRRDVNHGTLTMRGIRSEPRPPLRVATFRRLMRQMIPVDGRGGMKHISMKCAETAMNTVFKHVVGNVAVNAAESRLVGGGFDAPPKQGSPEYKQGIDKLTSLRLTRPMYASHVKLAAAHAMNSVYPGMAVVSDLFSAVLAQKREEKAKKSRQSSIGHKKLKELAHIVDGFNEKAAEKDFHDSMTAERRREFNIDWLIAKHELHQALVTKAQRQKAAANKSIKSCTTRIDVLKDEEIKRKKRAVRKADEKEEMYAQLRNKQHGAVDVLAGTVKSDSSKEEKKELAYQRHLFDAYAAAHSASIAARIKAEASLKSSVEEIPLRVAARKKAKEELKAAQARVREYKKALDDGDEYFRTHYGNAYQTYLANKAAAAANNEGDEQQPSDADEESDAAGMDTEA